MTNRPRLAAVAASMVLSTAVLVAATGCGSAESSKKTVVVFAAASLSKGFDQIKTQFEADHPDVTVQLSYDGSPALVSRLKDGAHADVLATADEPNMKNATTAKLVSTPSIFATNTLVLITPKGNPAHVTGLNASLTGKKLVVCAVPVPCGSATQKLATQLRATLHPVSTEQNVSDVRTKVESGEADAGVVYRTDATASGDKVVTITVPGASKVVNRYPIATTTSAAGNADAKAFVAAVLSPEGQQTLASLGFGHA